MITRYAAWPLAAAILLLPAAPGQEQNPASTRPQFEVASLKPNNGCENRSRTGASLSPSPGRLELPCFTLAALLRFAYGTFADGATVNPEPLHMEGGPSWMQSEYYSLSAKADGPARTEMLAGPMLRALLEERFRLKSHREMREIPVYAMTLGKGGIRVQPLADGGCTVLDLRNAPPLPKPGEPAPKVCGVLTIRPTGKGDMTIEVSGSMTQLAQRLSQFLDRTVVDKTGVPGTFNFHLQFVPDRNMPSQAAFAGREGDSGTAASPANAANATSPPDFGPDLFVAIQEQIGLKLSSDKGPVSFLIIDSAEKPTAN